MIHHISQLVKIVLSILGLYVCALAHKGYAVSVCVCVSVSVSVSVSVRCVLCLCILSPVFVNLFPFPPFASFHPYLFVVVLDDLTSLSYHCGIINPHVGWRWWDYRHYCSC